MKYNKIVWAIIVLVAIPVIIVGFIWVKESKNPFLIDYNTDQWAAILAAILGYVGTGTLGVLALWQNEKANELDSVYTRLQN